MRWSRAAAVLLAASAACVAQIPERGELTATPKFVEESPKPSFRSFTEAQLRSEIKILSTRSYAVYGYNTPEVRVQPPQVSNSAYSRIEFGPATLVSATGQKVPFELEESGYMDDKCASEIRFQTGNDKLIQFAHVRGHVKVKYPLAVKTATITATQPGPPELAAKIDGPYVNYVEDEEKRPPRSRAKLRSIRAYDAAGHQLEQHGYAETITDDNGAEVMHTSFFGNVARVEFDLVESWVELDLPYDLAPAPLLPAGHLGEDPEVPHQ